MSAGNRKRRIRTPAPCELRVQFNYVSHVNNYNKRRSAFRSWKGSRVVLSLVTGPEQSVVEGAGTRICADLLGLQNESPASIAINPPRTVFAVPMGKRDGALEHVILLGRSVRTRDLKQVTKLSNEALRR